jgi:H+/Cl- antiporter ClcA
MQFKISTLFFYLFKWFVITIVIGACIGTASAGFLISLDWVTDYRENHLWIIALLPIGGLLIGMFYHYYGKNVAAGNYLLFETILEPKAIIPFKMASFVYLGTIVTHLLGGSAGREGTALQMAGAIADQFSKPFRLSIEERRILIIAAIAAGFGSVFGTPLAGAVFALEVILVRKFRYNAIFPAFAAAFFADWITSAWNAPHSQYVVSFVPEISPTTLFYSSIAGIAFGLCAKLFKHSIHILTAFVSKKISFPPFRPFFGGILIAVVVLAIGTTKYIGLGVPIIESAFHDELPPYDFLLKLLFTVVTLSVGFKGGEVTPLFFIGATLGNALAFALPLPIGLLSGMGFVAVFAGASKTPIACFLMAIELFGIESAIYAAIACIAAYLVSGKGSIYQNQQLDGTKFS